MPDDGGHDGGGVMRSVLSCADDWLHVSQQIDAALQALSARQREDGHWAFELEADATIPAEYILLCHYLDEIDSEVERRIGDYLRSTQASDGGWPLFHAGDADISATVKAYYALKLIGDDPGAPHMRRARDIVLARGGASHANVFTRITLALFGQVPWRAAPSMPIELMLLPRWFPFHISKVSYWSRTVIVPLLILMAQRPRARNPRGIGIPELFVTPPDQERDYIRSPTGAPLGNLFIVLDRVLKVIEPRFPKSRRQRATQAALDFMVPRLNGDDGLGGIYPAMANAVMALDALGYPGDHPALETAKRAIRKLLVIDDRVYCQPCLSPVWDTALTLHAVMEAGEDPAGPPVQSALRWLADREIRDGRGDWAERRPGLEPSGWAFEYRNDYYPDVDDTAVVVMAMHRADPEGYREIIERAAQWIIGMQSRNGGWGSFDADNTHHYLNNIPFADHGALLDPPTVDVSARCLGMLAQLGYGREHEAVRRAIDFIRREQEPDGSWYGRWGVNYVYGTWSALCGLNAAGEDMGSPYVRKAVAWLERQQRDDGGWGEDCGTYSREQRGLAKESTPSQTAWAVLGLMAAGEVDGEAVRRGIEFLMSAPRDGARWQENFWTGTGFPRVFYLKYHGYAAYFPLWALARYKDLMRSNERRVGYGI